MEQNRAYIRDFNSIKKSEVCCSLEEINALNTVWDILKGKKREIGKIVLILISCCSVVLCLRFLGAVV